MKKNIQIFCWLVWFSLLLTAPVIGAEQAGKVGKAIKTVMPETAESALASPAVRHALRALSRDVHSLQARFTQYQLETDGSQRDKSTGSVALMAPNRFRWHYQAPQEQLIIATGKQILIYDPDLEQLTIKPQNNDHNPIYVLFNPDLIDEHYRIVESLQRDGLLWVQIVPRQDEDNVQAVWLVIDEKNNRLVQIQLLDKLSQVVVFEFSDIRRNPELPESLFQFEPPAGTDVVRDQPPGGEF